MSRKVVNYNQKGYVGQSMSVRARIAYESGEMPLSKWTKKVIISALEESEYPQSMIDKAKKLTLKELKEQALEETSCHHTGKFAQMTSFYSLVPIEDMVLITKEERQIEIEKTLQRELKEVKEFLNTYKEDVILIGNYGIKTKENKSFGIPAYMSVFFRQSNDFDAEVTRLVEEHNKEIKK